MRETRPSGSEGGETETNRSSLPLLSGWAVGPQTDGWRGLASGSLNKLSVPPRIRFPSRNRTTNGSG
jgi:hypothetical protein